jgi:hypothetical protein
MANINPLTLTSAVQVGAGIYELILTNWGNLGTAAEPNNGSIIYPSLPGNQVTLAITQNLSAYSFPPPQGMYALAIAPRSDIDRCIINYISQPQAAPSLTVPPPLPGSTFATGFVQNGGILETEQVLSINSPLIGQQVGPLVIRAHPSTFFGDTYVQTTTGSSLAFGTNSGVFLGGFPFPPAAKNIFQIPQLRLLMYTSSKAPLPPTIRAPAIWGFSEDVSGNTTEKLIRILPISGRTQIVVSVQSVSGTSFTVRLTGMVYLGNNPAAGNIEIPLFPTTTIAGSASQNMTICSSDIPSGITFLLIYMEPAPAGGGGSGIGNFIISAQDIG